MTTKPFPLPVRMVGAGSQPDDGEELQYLDMPRGMNTFSMPSVPDNADPDAILIAPIRRRENAQVADERRKKRSMAQRKW